ncbi:MAG: cytochrome c oxidase assembly protein [Gammaproteobacteria bacterium]|nr:cytochrome c oxidase assembly protein [Gammaproteobacteria bacterium]
MDKESQQHANKKLTRKLLFAAVFMFGFGFALVPLYNVMCDVLGLNGRFVDIQQGDYQPGTASSITRVDDSRLITVEFLANVDRNAPWEFRSMTKKMKVHPGEIKEVNYFAKNLGQQDIVAQAVPSLVPGRAVKYFTKMECFCFKQQLFKKGEGKMMPLRFFVDPDLPKDVNTISIAYTFFDTTKNAKKSSGRSELASAQTVHSGTAAK